MSDRPEKIYIQIKYKGVEQQFSAEPQEAWLLLTQFFNDLIPCFDIAQKLCLKVDFLQLAKDLNGIAAFSDDDANLLVPKNKLTDNEALLVLLVAYYLGHALKLVGVESLSKGELQVKVGKSGKITGTRLGELVKDGMVAKTADDCYRITAFGAIHVQEDIIPKIKAKTSF